MREKCHFFTAKDPSAEVEAEDKTAGIKNRFRWKWLDEIGRLVRDGARTEDANQLIGICVVCSVLHNHADKNADHRKAMEASSVIFCFCLAYFYAYLFTYHLIITLTFRFKVSFYYLDTIVKSL